MNKMMNPELEVVRFGAEDVIATSGGPAYSFLFSGLGNGTKKDATIQLWENGTFSSTIYDAQNVSEERDAPQTAINALGNYVSGVDRHTMVYISEDSSYSLTYLFGVRAGNAGDYAKVDDSYAAYNGKIFVWDSNYSRFISQ